jgi:hypothetical protein
MGGWVDGWVGGWMGGCKSRFKDCLQQSKIEILCFVNRVPEYVQKKNFQIQNQQRTFGI